MNTAVCNTTQFTIHTGWRMSNDRERWEWEASNRMNVYNFMSMNVTVRNTGGETDKAPDVYVVTVMTFGAACSPCCAHYVAHRLDRALLSRIFCVTTRELALLRLGVETQTRTLDPASLQPRSLIEIVIYSEL